MPDADITGPERQLIDFVRSSGYTITNALQVYARRMRDSAADLQADHQARMADVDPATTRTVAVHPAVGLARESASRAEDVVERLTELLDILDGQQESAGDADPVTRTVLSFGDPGRWQAQYRDATTELWHDIGDAQADKADAEAREADYRRRTTESDVDGTTMTSDEGVIYTPRIDVIGEGENRRIEVHIDVTLPGGCRHTVSLVPSVAVGDDPAVGTMFLYENDAALSHLSWEDHADCEPS